jgi:oligoendopeptidase F
LKKLLSSTSNNISNTKLGDLPTWDLSDLYDGKHSELLIMERKEVYFRAKKFEKDYKGNLSALSGDKLVDAIKEYEEIEEVLAKMMSFASLLYAADMTETESGQFYQNTQEKITEISTNLLFFTLELNQLDNSHLTKIITESKSFKYESWIRDIRAYKPHQLSDEVERLILEKQVVGRASWVRLFDETLAKMRFKVDHDGEEKELTSTEIFDLLSDKEGAIRKGAAKSIGKVLSENASVFTLITNTLAKDKEIEDRWRRFDKPVSSRNLSNFVEDEVVDALIHAVKEMYPKLSHRYYKIKAGWFGSDVLQYWDRNAPLPNEDNRIILWDEAVKIVLSAYEEFSEEMADIGRKFFDNNWIDAQVRKGKSPGAFAHPTVPSVHPYLLLNYQGKIRDVMTLAHELGHGVHQCLASEQGHLMSDTPLTLAETASVFAEMLTFRKLLDDSITQNQKTIMIAGKIEDMLNTVVRQVAFFEFERNVHEKRLANELLTEEICDIWMQVQRESLGPSVKLYDEYAYYWSYIPHFIHSPFYVYAYAFGDCLVNSLFAEYQENKYDFNTKYLDMLRAGGTLRHKELLSPFDLDASDPSFWNRGLSVISDLLDELGEVETKSSGDFLKN